MSLKLINIEELKVRKLHKDARLPIRSTTHAAGYDLFSVHDGKIPPRGQSIIRTGIAIRLPYLEYPFQVFGHILSRSGLAFRHGLSVGAGVIDLDYEQEINVIMSNHSDKVFEYKVGERIAQLVLQVHIVPQVKEVDYFPTLLSDRTGGFGSTGL